jgi:2-phosphosulfolactate phosphatase
MTRSVEVCFSPISYPVFKNDGAIVVVIDIFRATTAICTAFHHGVKSVIPVATVEEALIFKTKGFLTAAERHGEVVEGFELGNSPFSYMGNKIANKTIVLTTTNGTQAIEVAKDAFKLVIGAFVNFTFLTNWLIEQNCDVVLLCAGWKNKFNLEDTLFAGAVIEKLINTGKFVNSCDTAQAACHLYKAAKSNMFDFLKDSSHRKRLEKLNLEKDIRYCLQIDSASVIPILENNEIVKLAIPAKVLG